MLTRKNNTTKNNNSPPKAKLRPNIFLCMSERAILRPRKPSVRQHEGEQDKEIKN